ncbi:hypothetical protein DITRI_Ditri11bG0034400 [Diplodiscus trichospermus]
MDDFGAKEKAEASNQNPEKIRARQPQEKRSPDGSETLAEAEASDKRKMIKPVHKRQKQCTDETKHAVCSSNKLRTRGRRPTLTKDQKRENKKQSCRRFRERKNAKHKELEEKCQELEKEKKTLEEEMKELMKQTGMEKEALQSEINSLKACMNSKEEELPEIVRADKLKREMSNDVNMLRMLNKVMEPNLQTLQQNILSQDNQVSSQR